METKKHFSDIDSSSSSSSSPLKRKRGSGDPDLENGNCDIYDVFISFRGEDTRTGFTSHVHKALSSKQIKAFIDNEDLRTGHELSDSLLKAIETSKLYLVIFSPNYGSSSWCLLELEKILRCSEQHGKKVVPVFYKVDPSHVRNQTGSFGDLFASKHEGKEEKEKVLNWRDALKKAADLKGWHLNDHKLESEFIDEIVAVILRELKPQLLSIPSNVLVGVSPHIEKIVSLLRMDSPQVRSVGIWGMGGMGKTTIAESVLGHVREESVFGRIHRQFDGCYFFGDVREEVTRSGKVAFLHKLVSEILEGENSSFGSNLRLHSAKPRLLRKKVFIVFDDVDDSTSLQLQELAEHHELLGMGSKILMTSRDRRALVKLNVDDVYEFVGLKDEEALKLFSLKAFKKELPPVEYLELSNRVVCYARGNALALTVLGSELFNRDEAYWHSALKRIEKFPKKSIIDLLRISYDGLSREERDVFLDIICFFKGEYAYQVEHLLNDFYDCVRSIMINLVDKSLICIIPREKKIGVHDLVQEMGFKMVDEDEVANPGKYKRLYKSTDIYSVLTNKKGIETIQGIRLNLSEGENMNFELDAFFKMVNLRWLKIYQDVFLPKTQRMIDFRWLMRFFKRNHEVFFPHLRFLYWEECPLESLSSTFNIQSLVKLSLSRSKVERLWSGVQDVVNLRWMDLSESQNLIEIPDMSKAKNMEHINLRSCFNLIRLHPSVQYLNNLEVLDVSLCLNLCETPNRLESKVLRNFNINCCRNITKFPEMSIVNSLFIWDTGIEELPSSLQFLTGLASLTLCDNKKLRSISCNIFTLKSLKNVSIERCGLISFIPKLLQSLQVETISAINNHFQLCRFILLDCPELDHESLRMIHVFLKLQVGKDTTAMIQGSEIPEWFPPQNVCVGSSVTLQLPPNLDDNCSFTAFAVLVALEVNPTFIGLNPPPYLRFRIYDHDLLAAEKEIQLILLSRPSSHVVVIHSFSLDSDTCEVIREILSGKYYSNPKISFHFLNLDVPKGMISVYFGDSDHPTKYVVKKCGVYVRY